MDNMAAEITKILNDRDAMNQIMEMAAAFGLSADGQSQQIPPGAGPELSQVLQHVKEKEEKQQALVRALLPYLRPGHQKKLEQALQVARLSQFASAALKSGQKEAQHDV